MQKKSAPHLYKLVCLSKEKALFDGMVQTLTAPGEMGYFQVLAQHAPMIALLKAGPLTFVDSESHSHSHQISGGILEVARGEVTVLVDSLIRDSTP